MSHPIPQEVEEKCAEFEKIWEHPLHRDTSSFTKASINAKYRQALLSVYNSGREAEKDAYETGKEFAYKEALEACRFNETSEQVADDIRNKIRRPDIYETQPAPSSEDKK